MALTRTEIPLDLVALEIARAGFIEAPASLRIDRTLDRRDHRLEYYRATFVDEPPGTIRQECVLAKFHGLERARRAHEAASRLWDAGFCPPSRVQVARSLGYSKSLGAGFQEMIQYPSWLDVLTGDRGSIEAASRLPAQWLAKLHSVVGLARPTTPDLSSLEGAASTLAKAYPRRGARLVDDARLLVDELTHAQDPLLFSHGDYHPKNVLCDGSTLVVVDLDKVATREASFDCGDAIAQLLVMSHYELATTAPGAMAATAFWRQCADSTSASPARTALHIRRALTQTLAYKHLLGGAARSGREDLERWVALLVDSAADRDPDSIIDRSKALTP